VNDKIYNTKILRFAKKLKAIQFLGGKCEKCGETNFFKLCFHHTNSEDKEYRMSSMWGKNWKKIEREVEKCELMCQNCHYEFHEKPETFRTNDKKIFLEYKNVEGCEKCGYNNTISALHFHHLEDKKFEFRFVKEYVSSIEEIRIEIIEEINKCQILCANCHTIEHSDVNFFNENYEIIKNKSLKFKKMSSKIDIEIVRKMYFDGVRQIDISKILDCSKSTISGIVKNF
jgi:hypothetical protein